MNYFSRIMHASIKITLLLLIFMYNTVSYADFEMYIEKPEPIDTKISITSENNSDYVVAEVFTRNRRGERVFLEPFLINREQPFILPLGMGALLHGPDGIQINTQDIVVEGYTGFTTTHITASTRTCYCMLGMIRMVWQQHRNTMYRLLLRRIIEHRLGEEYGPLVPHLTPHDLNIIEVAPLPTPEFDANPTVPQTNPFQWINLPGDFAYFIPPPLALIRPTNRPPYMLATVNIENPDHDLTPIRTFLLHPREVLPRFPGLRINITAFNYVIAEDLHLGRVAQQRTPSAPPTMTLENGIVEMLGQRLEEAHERYRRVVLVDIADLRPNMFRHAWDIAPNRPPIPEGGAERPRGGWRGWAAAALDAADLSSALQ